MTVKEKIKLFVPPICFRLRSKILSGVPIFYTAPTHEEVMYRSVQIINKQRDLELTNLDALSENIQYGGMNFWSANQSPESSYYGSFYTMQKYAGLPTLGFPPKALRIQHGIVYDMLNWEYAKLNDVNWVWSPTVVNLFREHTNNPDIIEIGAPFFYAQSVLSAEKIAEEKKRLGHNLLAFPMHSTYNVYKEYDPTHFLSVLNEQRKQFDSVRVCVYWRDWQRGFGKIYKEAGFECVCSGHLFDPFFLERQKALFEIADATISNALGSHVGYSIYMNKPHCLITDEFELKDLRGSSGKEEADSIAVSSNYKKIQDAFSNNTNYNITQYQKSIVDEFWGVSSIKSPAEVRGLIMSAYRRTE